MGIVAIFLAEQPGFAGDLEVSGEVEAESLEITGDTQLGESADDELTIRAKIVSDLDLDLNELRNAVLENLPAVPGGGREGQMFWHATAKAPHWYDADNTRWRRPSATFSATVAAVDSPNREAADQLCDGTADEVEIASALAALPATGGRVSLAPGRYQIDASFIIGSNAELYFERGAVLDLAPGVELTIAGVVTTPPVQIFSGPGLVEWKTGQPIYPEYFGIDGVDDDIEINKATMALPASGGEVRLLGGKTYVSSGMISIKSHTRLIGQGTGTRVLASESFVPAELTPMIEVMDDHHHTEVGHVWFQSNGAPLLYGWHGHNGTYNNWVHHSRWSDFNTLLTGAIDPSGSYQNVFSNNILDNNFVGYYGTDTNVQYGNVVADNIFIDCRVSINFSYPYEATITGNVVQSSAPNALGIALKGSYQSNGRVVISNNVVRLSNPYSPYSAGLFFNEGGVWGANSKIVVHGNFFDSESNAGIEFAGNASRILVFGNAIRAAGSRPAILFGDDPLTPVISDIDITDNQLYGTAQTTAIEIGALAHSGITIRDNHFFDFGDGVEIVSGTSSASGTRIVGNTFTNVATPITDGGVETMIQRNLGFATEASGTATVSSNDTFVDVPHGLAIPPPLHRIGVVPTNDFGSATKFWVSEANVTTFRINLDVTPGTDATFGWQIGSD